MKVLRFLALVLGWLLTPFVAWAASFLGGVAGAVIAGGIGSPTAGLYITGGCGAVAGFGTLAVMIYYLRRSPRLRHALHVTADAMPDTSELLAPEPPPDAPVTVEPPEEKVDA